MKVVGGSASVSLAKAIAREMFAGSVDVLSERDPCGFSDGKPYLRPLGSVAGDHVLLVQRTCPAPSVVGFSSRNDLTNYLRWRS